jgi:MFS family permease
MGGMALGKRYWTLWVSSAFANLGDGVFQVAVALLAVGLTRSPALVAGVALANKLPWLFLALPAGALADRVDRRRTMLWANGVRVALLALLAAASALDVASIWSLYAVSLGLGIAEVLFDTSSQTLMPAVVDKPELSRANGRLFAVELVMNQFVGPPLGGLLVAVSGAVAVGASAGTYVAALVALALLRGTYRTARTGPRARLRTDIAEGVRYLMRHRLLRTLGWLLGAQNLLTSAGAAVFVLYATSPSYGLGLSDAGVGLLFTVMAIGGVAGSFVGAPLERRIGRSAVLCVSLLCGGVAWLVPGVSRNVVLVALGLMLSGAASMWNVVTVSLRQRIIPDELLGRVNSAYRLLGWGSLPIGAAVGGLVGEVFSVRAVFVLAAVLLLALIVPLRVVVTDAAIVAAEAESDRVAAAGAATGAGAGAGAGAAAPTV